MNAPASKRVLLIPFHFPPLQGSTGASRSFEFSRFLPESGWNVSVLTVKPSAYPKTSDDIDHLLPQNTQVTRTFALDAKKHFSIGGRYFRWTALPDRWSTWIFSGTLKGLRLIKKNRPDVIYTTYPTPSAHVIGMLLHKMTGVPWVAEFRDPMVEENYPEKGLERWLRIRLEKRIFKSASRVVSVTPSARDFYERRAGRGSEFAVEIANGYNDSLKKTISLARSTTARKSLPRKEIVHSGFLYEDVRNPRQLMLAIRDLQSEGKFESQNIVFVFRGSGNDENFKRDAVRLGIEAVVEFRESVSYRLAYEELAHADALLLLQGRQCNRQIPAKIYEYCVLQKPMLCLADPNGDTGRLFESLGLGKSAALEDRVAIKENVIQFLDDLREGNSKIVNASVVSGMSREARTKELANLLDAVHNENSTI